MRAGQLRKRIKLQRAIPSKPDAYGAVSDSWSDLATRWAEIKPLIGKEKEQAAAVKATVTHSIRLRYLEGLTMADRVKWDNRIFEITDLQNIHERDREIKLTCTELVE